MIPILKQVKHKISSEQIFMISVLLVNGGNYLYNLALGRILGPAKFADAAIMITFLLVLSFIAMTFQLVTAKFSVLFEDIVFKNFISKIYKNSAIVGVVLGIIIIVFSSELQVFFKTTSATMFIVFGIGVPIYFLMSVNRGVFQGKKQLKKLSITYQLEMISRLLITFALLYFLNIESSILIAFGILCSFVFGLIPFEFKNISFSKIVSLEKPESKMVRNFFIITAFYELTQIIINNSDILLVKHYFESYDAGLYASLALIGRVVYFIAWMFVMLLLPTVVQLKKEGKPTVPILLKYVGYIFIIAATIVTSCYFFPEQIIAILFGNEYMAITPLLWKYAVATGIFAISNIFAYYYLSLDKYIPVVISGLFGMLQIGLIILFHKNLEQVVHVQILAMVLLLLMQLSFFFFKDRK
ncbi:sugar isomerase [Tenacibaculum finnmarkense]|uniref:sugar isomerase n=1 Tax=Tenacibaculum finnmarkense TaxID=2781243 RepID=UPI00187B6EEA|nr:sugar isomerase [Tenacibaculum finnmarkense]MBE7660286.1 sugar isomerase [Tenacibaculum finnmarkense genomovar finnmarkense]MCG8251974.1 sugar isomerase [Tenacibaculum finnmarkense genomovar finnmarkense]MCG8815503.1 sugar isomerase [Tenacibaculum finnmarkense]MCG8820527.1 sugar isomerase [Tenacibaculum finnmarkense]MCG8893039.1 sugar isomerase [Tenacibaculum finnmarkense]